MISYYLSILHIIICIIEFVLSWLLINDIIKCVSSPIQSFTFEKGKMIKSAI